MRAKGDPALRQGLTDMEYYDELTRKKLDPKLVTKGEHGETAGFKKMGVYEHVSRARAINDSFLEMVTVKWVPVNKGAAITQKCVVDL